MHINNYSLFFCLASLCLFFGGELKGALGYKNYTVGDDSGWFDKLEDAKVDYQSWASLKNFSLGDFLIFNSDKNHSIIQTYNLTTYTECNGLADDTIDWSTGVPTADDTPVTVAVPLVKEGPTYFFSGDYSGEQCQDGQKFKITVEHGQGLPTSLIAPKVGDEAISPAPTGSISMDDDSVPDTVVPANFDHPNIANADANGGDGSEDNSESSGGGCPRMRIFDFLLVFFVFCGLVAF